MDIILITLSAPSGRVSLHFSSSCSSSAPLWANPSSDCQGLIRSDLSLRPGNAAGPPSLSFSFQHTLGKVSLHYFSSCSPSAPLWANLSSDGQGSYALICFFFPCSHSSFDDESEPLRGLRDRSTVVAPLVWLIPFIYDGKDGTVHFPN